MFLARLVVVVLTLLTLVGAVVVVEACRLVLGFVLLVGPRLILVVTSATLLGTAVALGFVVTVILHLGQQW